MFRAYDLKPRRWLSRDPLGEEAGINLYGYVQNDPINEYDPFGLDDITLGTPGSDDYSLGVSPASNPDVPSDALTIDAHGNSQNIYTGTNNNDGKAISAQQLAAFLKRDPRYNPKKPVVINACKTGQSKIGAGPNFAQQLSAELGGNTVYAPTDNIIRSGVVTDPNAPATDVKITVENGGVYKAFISHK